MSITEEFLQDLKMRCDITDVVSSYVNLKRRGRNMVGLCPFHSEKTPSFTLYPENGSFYCFGCGAGGDVISFVRKIENLDYVEAVKLLAQRVGMEMPENSYDDGMSRLRNRIFEANRAAARFYNTVLYSEQGAQGLEYLRRRQLKENTIRHFGLGFAPNSRFALTDHLHSAGFSDNEIVQSNLGFKSKGGKTIDRFFNRTMFPIIDLRGNVIAFGGRIMTDEKPKYLNTSDTLVFKKSNTLFALNMAKNSGKRQLILAEGYMDVIALHQAGFTNAVATLGTALTQQQAMLMKRYADEAVISYDADEAGQKAARRAISLLRDAGLLIKVLRIPGAKDPDEFIKAHKDSGAARFKQLIDNSGNDIEYRLEAIKQNYDLNRSEDKVGYLTEACKILASLNNPIEQEIYGGKLSDQINVQREAIMQQIKRESKAHFKDKERRQFRQMQTDLSARSDKINPQKADNLRCAKAEEALIAFIMNNPDKAKQAYEKLAPDKIKTDFNRRVYTVLTHRLLNGKTADITDLSSEFSSDEMSRISGILNTSVPQQSGDTVLMNEYIDVILSENDKLSPKQVADATPADIEQYLNNLKKNKK